MLRIAQLTLLTAALVATLVISSVLHADGPTSTTAANAPISKVPPLTRPDPNDNLDFWLNSASSKPTTAASGPSDEPPARNKPLRPDALPGVVELSTGQQMPGMLYTTRGKDWELYVEEDKNIHRIPFIAVLSITANVTEEVQELEWRWKEMGTPERVYTGKSYPTRRCTWTFHLIDGTKLTGTIKGQPLWIEYQQAVTGPLVMHERDKGEIGKTLKDLVYIKRIIVSKRMMDEVAKAMPTSQPAPAR